MKKSVLIFCVLLFVLITVCSVSFAKEFEDVPATHWAHEYISKLADEEVINGYADGLFKPNGKVTRAEFLKLIVSTSFLSKPGFELLKENASVLTKGDKWYTMYVELAKKENPYIYDDEMLNSPITRVEAVNILNRFARKDGFYMKSSGDDASSYYEIVNTFTDATEFTEEDQIAISNISRIGLMIGYQDGTFKPNNTMSRAEIATVIYRYMQDLGGKV